MSGALPYTSFPIHYPLTVLALDATAYNLSYWKFTVVP
jgi:hypothetical protein